MEIIYKSVEELIPYVNNSRTHSDEQIKQICASINEFGFTNPVLIDEKNMIIAGHGRVKAAERLEIEDVPCIVLKGLTETQKKAYIIADNKMALNAGWDEDLLKLELENLKELDFNLDLTGFNEEELTDIFGIDEKEIEEDNYDVEAEVEQMEEPTAKLGDIYQLGNHRLMCGDSTNPDDVDKLMNGELADLVFTDPPYGVSYKGTNNPNGREWEIIKNDDLRGDNLFIFLLEAFKNIKRKLKQGGAFYIWYANSNTLQFENALLGAELKKKQIIVWQKGMVLGHSDYHWTYEPCLYGCHPEQNSTWFGDRTQKTLWDIGKKEVEKMKKEELLEIVNTLFDNADVWEQKRDSVMEYIHPTQKPVALSAKAIVNSSQVGDKVLDLFGGSGSTLMGCEQLDRKAYLMEFDPKYVDGIIHRWEEFTGKKAILIESRK